MPELDYLGNLVWSEPIFFRPLKAVLGGKAGEFDLGDKEVKLRGRNIDLSRNELVHVLSR